jgi:hypothetical protein
LKNNFWNICAGLVAATFLTACGGGGGGGGGSEEPQDVTTEQLAGVYQGISEGQTVATLIVDTGHMYSLYGEEIGDTFYVSGLVVGRVQGDGSTFRTLRAHDFSLTLGERISTKLRGDFVSKESLNGTIEQGNATGTFSLTYDSHYELAPTLAALEGTFNGFAASGNGDGVVADNATVTVTNGQVAGSTATGCEFTGTLTPHTKGNVYVASVTLGSGCESRGSTRTGHAYARNDVLYIMVANSSTERADLFIGGR